MGLFDLNEFQDELNRESEKFFKGRQDYFERIHDDADEMQEQTDRLIKRRDKEIAKLRIAESIAYNREQKSRIFGNLKVILFNNMDTMDVDYTQMDEFTLNLMVGNYKDLILRFLSISRKEGVDAVGYALTGYAKSLHEFGKHDKLTRYWSEIFYLIEEGIDFKEKNVEYFLNILRKEIGNSQQPELQEVESLENFLKRCYTAFKVQPYWGYDFIGELIDKRVQDRLSYFSSNIFPEENEDRDSVPGLDEYIRKHILEYDRKIQNVSDDEDDDNEDEDENEEEEMPQKKSAKKSSDSAPAKKLEFPGLDERFKRERDIDESIEPKGFFDFATKSRNNKVEKLQDKRSDIRDDINDNKKELISLLKSLISSVKKLLTKEAKLAELEKKKEEGKLTKSQYKDKKEDYIDSIKDLKGDIKDYNKDIKKEFDSLLSHIATYNNVNAELCELTSSDRYAGEYSVEGESVKIVKEIAKNTNLTDSAALSEILKQYL